MGRHIIELTPEQKDKIKEMRNDTKSYYDIYLETGIDQSRIGRFCKEEGLNKNNSMGKKHRTIFSLSK